MRVAIDQISNPSWYLKPLFWLQKKKYGRALNSSLVWATMPRAFLSLASLYGALDRKKSPLAPALRSLIIVRVSQINECAFCIDINSANLIQRSGTEGQCLQLNSWRQSTLFSPSECAALDYAERVTYSDQHPDDACFNLLKVYYNEQEIIELTALIAFQNMSSKFNSALEIESQGFCRFKKI